MTGRWRFPRVNWRPRNAMSSGGSSCSSRSFVRLPSLFIPLIIRPCAVMHGTPAVMAAGSSRRGAPIRGRAISLAKELGDAISTAFALYERALVHRMMLEPKLALEIAGAAINIAEDVGFLYVLRHARIIKGWALTELGRAEEGVGQIREETDALSANREELWLTLCLATLADACLKAGHIEHGLKAIGDALDLVRRSGECFWEAEINRLRGELLLGQSPSDPARGESVSRARDQEGPTAGGEIARTARDDLVSREC